MDGELVQGGPAASTPGAPALAWENGLLRLCSSTRRLGELEAAPARPAPLREKPERGSGDGLGWYPRPALPQEITLRNSLSWETSEFCNN